MLKDLGGEATEARPGAVTFDAPSHSVSNSSSVHRCPEILSREHYFLHVRADFSVLERVLVDGLVRVQAVLLHHGNEGGWTAKTSVLPFTCFRSWVFVFGSLSFGITWIALRTVA